MILINYNNKIYKIEKEPNELEEDTYKRGWFIIKNYNNYPYNELISRSIIYLNNEYGMIYSF